MTTSNLISVEENNNLGLRLFTFTSCQPEDSIDVKINRSVILDNTDTVICKSLPYTTEIENLDDEQFNNLNLDDYDICPSIEGSLIRLFYFNNQWIISTNRKIDAFSSYWSSRFSFGQLFMNHLLNIYPNQMNHVLEYFYSKLNTTDTYFFLIQSNYENRVVCNVPEPKMYYVGKYVNNDYSVLNREPFDSEGSIPQIQKITTEIKSVQDLKDYIMGHVLPFDTQGLLLFNNSTNEQIKIYHPEYRRYWRIRNNVPNLQLRYLQLRLAPETELSQFFTLYPRFRPVADRIENDILEIARLIYHAYVNRFIRKQYVSIPREMYHILKMAHEWHISDRTNNKIYFHKIMTFVNEQEPGLLLGIIRKFLRQQQTTQRLLTTQKNVEQNQVVEQPIVEPEQVVEQPIVEQQQVVEQLV